MSCRTTTYRESKSFKIGRGFLSQVKALVWCSSLFSVSSGPQHLLEPLLCWSSHWNTWRLLTYFSHSLSSYFKLKSGLSHFETPGLVLCVWSCTGQVLLEGTYDYYTLKYFPFREINKIEDRTFNSSHHHLVPLLWYFDLSMSFPLGNLTITPGPGCQISDTVKDTRRQWLHCHGCSPFRSTMELGWICLSASSLSYLPTQSTLSINFLSFYACSDFTANLAQPESARLFTNIYLSKTLPLHLLNFTIFGLGDPGEVVLNSNSVVQRTAITLPLSI